MRVKDLIKYCRSHECDENCAYHTETFGCRLTAFSPCEWDTHIFTLEEIALAKALIPFVGADAQLEHHVDCNVIFNARGTLAQINGSCFNTLDYDERVTLAEIAGMEVD